MKNVLKIKLNIDKKIPMVAVSDEGNVSLELLQETLGISEDSNAYTTLDSEYELEVITKDDEIKSITVANNTGEDLVIILNTDKNTPILCVNKPGKTDNNILKDGHSWYWSKYGISNNLKKFYTDIAESKRKENWDELLKLDGPVVLDLRNYKNKEAMIVMNCKNNVYYFLDQLGIKLDIGSYMAIRLHLSNHPISLELPKGLTEYSSIIYGYAAWKLLFTNEDVLLPLEDHECVEDIYRSLPEFLKIKTFESFCDNLLSLDDLDKSKFNISNINIFYINKEYNEEFEFNGKTIIAADFRKAKTYYDPIITKLGVASNPFKQVKFNMFDLGYDMEKAEELLAYEDESLERFLNNYVL